MYLRECLIENVGPLEGVDLTLPFHKDGTPKPIVLVGQNGSGKTVLLSHIVDALIEFAKPTYRDVVIGQSSLRSPYFKILGGATQRSGTAYGIALLRFADEESVCCYIDKSGALDPSDYQQRLQDRFPTVKSWPKTGNHKAAEMPVDLARRFFRESTVCFFPAARHERPHWLNRESVADEPVFYFPENYDDKLYKPVVVESAAQANRQWLLDVVLDSRVDIEPYLVEGSSETQLRVTSDLNNYLLLRQSRMNVETVLREVLQDAGASLRVNYRSISPYRLAVQLGDGRIIPSLDHLSAGQANLLNLFWTIIRYGDRTDINKSHRLNEISGIVLVDEIEAQAHTDLQYEVLPKLLKLFPKVQFLLTSHSPLFLLGMENLYTGDGFQIVEMPSGQTITTERFSEFQRSWDYYTRTAAYERSVEDALRSSSKPIVLTEGETDPVYIKTALKLLGREDILNALDIQSVGNQGPHGSINTGVTALNNAAKLLRANPDLTIRSVLLLYDADANKAPESESRLMIRSLPKNESNTKAKRGIENLLPQRLFTKKFYPVKKTIGDYGEQKSFEEFDKMRFCQWVCTERRNTNDFSAFKPVVEVLEEFLEISGDGLTAPECAPSAL